MFSVAVGLVNLVYKPRTFIRGHHSALWISVFWGPQATLIPLQWIDLNSLFVVPIKFLSCRRSLTNLFLKVLCQMSNCEITAIYTLSTAGDGGDCDLIYWIGSVEDDRRPW